jgi:hypothetical protein
MKKYRIREFNNVFTIQVEEERTTGFLWWKKKKKEWIFADIYGNPVFYYDIIGYLYPPCKSFNSMEEAVNMVDVFKKGFTYTEL